MNKRVNWILALIALILAGIAWAQGGTQLVLQGLLQGTNLLIEVIPLLLAAFLIAGLAQVLITSDFVNRWLGSTSGWRGIALACIGGALLPGGPYVYFPIAAVLLKSGASLGVVVTFVTARNLLSLTRIPIEIALLGTRLTLIQLGVTFFMAPVLGVVAEALFGKYVERIREAISL